MARPSPGRRRNRSRVDTAVPLEATRVSDGESRAWLAAEDGLRPYGPPLRPSSFPFIVATCAAVTSGRHGGGGLTAEGGQAESGQMRGKGEGQARRGGPSHPWRVRGPRPPQLGLGTPASPATPARRTRATGGVEYSRSARRDELDGRDQRLDQHRRGNQTADKKQSTWPNDLHKFGCSLERKRLYE